MSSEGIWLKDLDLTRFENRRYALFRLGHFLDDYPAIDAANYERCCREVNDVYDQRWIRAVQSYQRYNGVVWRIEDGVTSQIKSLRVDGDFGKLTTESMQERTCACRDRLAAGPKPQWAKTHLVLWHDMETLPGLTFAQAKTLYLSAAMDFISSNCGLTFEWGSSYNVFAHARRIDGTNRTLAWSELPPSNRYAGRALEQRYDTSDRQTIQIMAHELMHAMGLEHSRDPDSLMYPSLGRQQDMHSWEIGELQERYGPPQTDPEPDPLPLPPDQTVIKVGDRVRIEGTITRI